MIDIVIADDHELFRDGLKLMLENYDDVKIVAEAINGNHLINLANKHQPQVIITDINMPELDGIKATEKLLQQNNKLCIIGLSMYDDDDLIIDMLEAGALGYLIKNADKQEIITAVRTVANYKPYYCKHTSQKVIKLIKNSNYNPYNGKPKALFDEKETTIIKLICEQLTAKEISEKVFLSPRTVEGIKIKIMEKMDVTNNVGIAIYAIKHKIIL